ncbi:MAG: hypothetical protein ACE5KT_06165 [Methanosarcinales archaeon]
MEFKNFNMREHADKGKMLYEKLRDTLEPRYKGKTLVIDVETGDYAIGDSLLEASEELEKKHPNKVFYAARIGQKAYYKRHW